MEYVKCLKCRTTNRIRPHEQMEVPKCGRCGAQLVVPQRRGFAWIRQWLGTWMSLPREQQGKLFQSACTMPGFELHERIAAEALTAWNNKDLDTALMKYDEAIENCPNNSTYLLNRANLHFERCEFESAMCDYESSLAGAPTLPSEVYGNYELLKAMSEGAKRRLRERRLGINSK